MRAYLERRDGILTSWNAIENRHRQRTTFKRKEIKTRRTLQLKRGNEWLFRHEIVDYMHDCCNTPQAHLLFANGPSSFFFGAESSSSTVNLPRPFLIIPSSSSSRYRFGDGDRLTLLARCLLDGGEAARRRGGVTVGDRLRLVLLDRDLECLGVGVRLRDLMHWRCSFSHGLTASLSRKTSSCSRRRCNAMFSPSGRRRSSSTRWRR